MTNRSTLNDSKAVLIVAIDFGTTYSGAAFAFSDNVKNQTLVSTWPSKIATSLSSVKVPTRIAYLHGNEGPVWGFQILETDPRYQEFKLSLDEHGKNQRSDLAQEYQEAPSLDLFNTKSESEPKSARATRLTIDFLKEMRKCIEQSVDRHVAPGTLEFMHTEYVITVPAIWSDGAKDLTKYCAQEAGMCNTTLISEPEAAMVSVLQDKPVGEISAGDTYMVCDAGGGTVDLITYQVASIKPLTVREVSQGDDAWCGSTYITRQFRKYIMDNIEVLGPSWTQQQTNTAIETFENTTKRHFDGKEDKVVIKVPGAKDYLAHDIEIHKQKLFLPAARIREMFNRVCRPIFNLIRKQHRQAIARKARTKEVILVGGFAQSQYLQNYLRDNIASLDKSVEVTAPDNGWSAVVRGALSRALPIIPSALPGARPTFPKVTSRYARRYYGITYSRPFDPDRHPDDKKYFVESDGTYWIECIYWFLEKNKHIKESFVEKRSYEHSWRVDSTNPKDSTIVLNIVSWNDEEENKRPTKFPDQPNIEKMNNLNVNLLAIPKEELIQKWNDKTKTMFYECYPELLTPSRQGVVVRYDVMSMMLFLESQDHDNVTITMIRVKLRGRDSPYDKQLLLDC